MSIIVRKINFFLFICFVFLNNAFSYAQSSSSEFLTIVSVSPLSFIPLRLAEGISKVEVLLPSNANPHTFEPSFRQLQAISKAKIYIKVGHLKLPFETRLLSDIILERGKNLVTINASEGLTLDEDDPHIWLSVKVMKNLAKRYAQELAALSKEHSEQINTRLTSLLSDIDSLDLYLKELFRDKAAWKFFVFHPSWGYFANEYGLIQLSLEQHGKETGTYNMTQQISFAKKLGCKVLFVQPQISKRAASIAAKQIGAQVVELNSLDADWLANMKKTGNEISKALVR